MPSGYVQQSPWLSIANKQMEMMGRYMGEMALTAPSRSRVAVATGKSSESKRVTNIVFRWQDENGETQQRSMARSVEAPVNNETDEEVV